jgi:hypothetical protein
MRFLGPLFANLLLLLSAFGLGGFLRSLFPRKLSKLDRLALIPLGGLGLQGVLLFLLGLFRFSPGVILGLLVPGALLGVRCVLQEAREVNFSSVVSKTPVLPAMVIALVFAVTLLGGLAEPVGDIGMDTIAYHYLGPRVWLEDRVVRPVLDESHTAFPATVEIQYAPLMLIGGQSAPELFSLTTLALILLLAGAMALRCGLSQADAWWIAALLSTMPALYRGLYGGMIDVIYAAFLIAAARFAFDAERPADYVLAGLFCGFALGTKYSALVAIALLLVSFLTYSANSVQRFSRATRKGLVLLCVVTGFIASPWYVRNWLVLGGPIYPPTLFLNRFFPVRYFPPDAIRHFEYLMDLTGRGMGHGPLSLLMLPFNLTFHPANFEAGAGGIGLVPLAFLPFCFRACRWDSFSKALGLFAVLTTLIWFYTFQESRYVIQVYVIAAIFGVAGWRHVLNNGPRLAHVLSALTIATSILYGLFMIVATRADDLHAAISPSFAEHRKQAEIPFLDSFRFLNREPSVSEVLVLDPFVPTYYLNKPYVKPIGRRGEQPLPGIKTPNEVLADLSSLKITHVMDVQRNQSGFQVPEHPKNLILVFEESNQRIYRVSP